MANRHRGEVTAHFGGKPYRLCLTLGALAELEDRLGEEDILALARRFENGRISAREALAVIAAGLRGGGHVLSDAEIDTLTAGESVPGWLGIVIDLLQAAFGVAVVGDEGLEPAAEGASSAPFPGGG
ncbi:MAG TPA: transfer Agent [Alphaproteobacteria bacterium]|nr:transfer Agent [Alphaproteobacteria bacterium]HCO91350.1 transfer Agent [Alphaproteobacteria bacterium]